MDVEIVEEGEEASPAPPPPDFALNQVYVECAKYDTICLLCHSDAEAANYLVQLKMQENKADRDL